MELKKILENTFSIVATLSVCAISISLCLLLFNANKCVSNINKNYASKNANKIIEEIDFKKLDKKLEETNFCKTFYGLFKQGIDIGFSNPDGTIENSSNAGDNILDIGSRLGNKVSKNILTMKAHIRVGPKSETDISDATSSTTSFQTTNITAQSATDPSTSSILGFFSRLFSGVSFSVSSRPNSSPAQADPTPAQESDE